MAKAKRPTKSSRIPARKKPSRPRQRSQHYKECEARWENARKEGGDWLVDRPKLPVDADRFFATLKMLAEHLQNRHLDDLYRELVSTSGLVNRKTGKWSRYGTTLANPETRAMCELIEETIAARGFKEREAIADAVAELGLNAPSFATACKSVKRLLDAYRKTVGQKPR